MEGNGAARTRQDGRGASARGAWRLVVPLALALAVSLPLGLAGCGTTADTTGDQAASSVAAAASSTDMWGDSGLSALLPKPPSDEVDVAYDNDSSFRATVSGIDDEAFGDYVQSCKDAGFTVDASETSYSYKAYNSDGYHLSTSHSSDDESMTVQMSSPVANGTISWPSSGVGSLLPVPSSSTGEVSQNRSNSFSAKVTKTSRGDYDSYVDACMAAGFSENYSRRDTYFNGENVNGTKLTLKYEGFETMSVYIHCDSDSPDASATGPATSAQDSSSSAEQSSDASSSTGTASSEVTPSFKEAMDSYEAFFDQYAEFMKSYKDNGYPASMLSDYLSMMQQYSDCMEKLDAIDEGSLSAADDAYYVEVSARISQKLLEAAS